ncbi:MAG: hypothetical protein ACOYOV_00440 [Bacteroidales bacterium]
MRDAHNKENGALDVIAVNGLVPARFSKIDLTYISSGNGIGEVGEALYYSDGAKQQQTIICRNDELGSAHKTSLSFYNRTPQNLAGTYLVIYDDVGPVGIFFNTDGANSTPITSAVYRFIVVNLLGTDTEIAIANKLIAATDADSKFFSIGNQAFAVISNSTSGVRADSYDVNTNLYLRNVRGIDTKTLNSTYFTINAALDAQQYYVWYNVAGTGVDPLVSGRTALPVAIIVGATASQVAVATAAALSTYFLTNIDESKLTITNKLIGITTRIQDVTCFMPGITLDVAGTNRELVAHLVLTYDISCDLVSVERL